MKTNRINIIAAAVIATVCASARASETAQVSYPESVAAPGAVSIQEALAQMDAARKEFYKPAKKKYDLLADFVLDLGSVARGNLKYTLVWKSDGPAEIQVTNPDGSWVRRDVVKVNSLQAGLERAGEKALKAVIPGAQKTHPDFFFGDTVPADWSVSLDQAAQELNGLDGGTLLAIFNKEFSRQVAFLERPR